MVICYKAQCQTLPSRGFCSPSSATRRWWFKRSNPTERSRPNGRMGRPTWGGVGPIRLVVHFDPSQYRSWIWHSGLTWAVKKWVLQMCCIAAKSFPYITLIKISGSDTLAKCKAWLLSSWIVLCFGGRFLQSVCRHRKIQAKLKEPGGLELTFS